MVQVKAHPVIPPKNLDLEEWTLMLRGIAVSVTVDLP